MFNRSLQQRSSNHNYCLHTQRVFTQDWLNCFRITIACSVLPFIPQEKRWEGECKQVVYCYFCILFTLSMLCCCCLFSSLSLFYTDLVAIFLFIYVDHAFVYHFNNTISIFVIILCQQTRIPVCCLLEKNLVIVFRQKI